MLLLLVLGGILDALVASSTGLLRAQSAPLIVYSVDSKGSIDRSRVSAAESAAVAKVTGVHEATGLGIALLAGHIPGRETPADVALFERSSQPTCAGSAGPRSGLRRHISAR